MDLELWKRRKKELHLNYATLAALSHVSKRTIEDIFRGFTRTPRIDTVMAIEHALGLRVTDEERAAGVVDRICVWITPEEDELLTLFREMGEKDRNAARQTLIQLARELAK